MCAKSLSRVQLFVTPWTAATRLLYPWNFPGKNTGLGISSRYLPDPEIKLMSPALAGKLLTTRPPGKSLSSVQSLSQVWLCDPMNCSMPGLPVHHQLPESTQTHVHRVSDAIQPSHPLSSPSPPALNPSQHQGLFQWVNSLHEVAKELEFQPQHQSFQWTPRIDLL